MAKGAGSGASGRSGGGGPRTVDAKREGLTITRVERMKYPGTSSTARQDTVSYEFGFRGRTRTITVSASRTGFDEVISRLEQSENVRITNLPRQQVRRIDPKTGSTLQRDSRGMWR